MRELTPAELQTQLAGSVPMLLDVRETWDFELCRIPGSVYIPLNAIPSRHSEFDRKALIVCICHHGMRSDYAAGYLSDHGFSAVFNLTGGIDRWAREIDPVMLRY